MIGVIGGSGFYSFAEEQKKRLTTPFGVVTTYTTTIDKKEVVFIPRHGKGHTIPPHLINYRANVYAMHLFGVTKIFATSAVGSMVKELPPGDFLLPNQFIDFTSKRPNTFFDGDFQVTLPNGSKRQGVVHVDFTEPYCPYLREVLFSSGEKIDLSLHNKGVYICTEGPRFETAAEIAAFKKMGGSVVGMTAASEGTLARELGICYATICLVTNYAAGMQKRVSAEEVFSLFEKKADDLQLLINQAIKNIDLTQKRCHCLE
jgi:5'-methylthioadenosine phosphorylase